MPTDPRTVTGTGCGGMQETGGIETARSNAESDARAQACCEFKNVDTFEIVDERIYSVGKRTCIDFRASITCHESAKSCFDKKNDNPKL